MKPKSYIPIYSIDAFKNEEHQLPFQIELFDANRHFDVLYPHKHDFFEILYLTKGSGIHEIDFVEYEIKSNMMFFLSPGQVHNINTSSDVEGFIFLFTSDFYLFNKQNENRLLELPFFYNLSNETPPLCVNNQYEAQFMTTIFSEGIRAFNRNDEYRHETIEALLDLLLVTCERLYPIEQQESKKGKLLVKQFQQLIEQKYDQNMSVSNYAQLLNVTANHLTETVRKITGEKSIDLIKRRTLLEAQKLLTYTDLTITEIAYQLNFKDHSYFARVFKRYFGTSPAEYKKKK